MFGISQTYAYELMVAGKIKTVLLRKDSKQTRGKRLFDLDSVRAFIKQSESKELELSDSPFRRVQAARMMKAKARAAYKREAAE